MEDKLRAYMDHLFRDVPETVKSIEIKEEILQNLKDKYHDLISEGKSEDAAYNIAIASVGDLTELLSSLKAGSTSTTPDEQMYMQAKSRSAIFVAIAVMLYIVSILPPIIFSTSGNEIIGVCGMFVLIAIATGLLIFNNMTKNTYQKIDDTMMEDFKQWQNKNSSSTQLRKALQSAMWCIITVLYFIISFVTGAWEITWVLFLIGGALDSIIKALVDLKN